MYYQKRGKSFSFVYYDTTLRKNIRLPQREHPQILTETQAIAFCKRWDAAQDSQKVRIQKRLQWRDKYFDFQELLTIFEKSQNENAPNTWQTNSSYLKFYAFPFFLTEKKENNLNNWHYHFEEFRDHLQSAQNIRRKKKGGRIAYSTMNNIINALNGFMSVMYRRKYVEIRHLCRHFSSHLLNRSSEESVIDEETQEQIHSALRFRNEQSADFFHVSLHTGLRMNELLGLSLADFHVEEIHSEFMKQALKPYHLKVYGYLTVESQPFIRTSPRDSIGRVPRKPLKGKKRIDSKDCRIIPLFDKRAYNIVVRLWNKQRALFLTKRYGISLKDYLLFDGLTRSTYSSDMRVTQQKLRFFRYFSPHDTRHTYSTWIVDQTGGNYTLCRMILGHSDLNMTMRYVHVNALLRQQMKAKQRLYEPIELAV